jgi:hypothetical protein
MNISICLGEMFVTPLQTVYQLRPSFRHLDELDEKKKLKEQEMRKIEIDDEDEEAEFRPIKVSFLSLLSCSLFVDC